MLNYMCLPHFYRWLLLHLRNKTHNLGGPVRDGSWNQFSFCPQLLPPFFSKLADGSWFAGPNISNNKLPRVHGSLSCPMDKCLSDLLQEYEDTLLIQAWKEHGTTRKIAKQLGLSQPTTARKLKKLRQRRQVEMY